MQNPINPDEFRRQGYLMIDFLANYYKNIEKYPVRSQVKPGFLRNALPESAPYNPEPVETILQDVEKDIMPGITHWQSPNFFAYFQSNACKLRTFIRGHVKLGKHFEQLVNKDDRFEVVVPRNFCLVCFRMLVPNGEESDGNELNRKLLELLNDSGRVFMTHALIDGTYVIRCAIGATLTDYHHVNLTWKVVQEHVDVLLHVPN